MPSRLAYRLCYRLSRVHLTVMDRVTVQEAAQRLGISQDAVRQRIRRGSMRHDKDDKGRVYVYLNPTNTRAGAPLRAARILGEAYRARSWGCDKHQRVRKATVGVFARGTGLSFEK